MKQDITREIEYGEGIAVQVDGARLTVNGPKGESTRDFVHPKVTIALENNKIVLRAKQGTRREKTIIGSYESHIKNMLKGAENLHTYKLKICSGHFPMNVSLSGQEVTIKNFLGEAVPRKVSFSPEAQVKINGDIIEVTSPNKEVAGQTAAKIETLCRITDRDRRIFQDGCYIIHKAGKDI